MAKKTRNDEVRQPTEATNAPSGWPSAPAEGAIGYGQGWKVRTVKSGVALNQRFWPQPDLGDNPEEGSQSMTASALKGFLDGNAKAPKPY